MQILTVDVGTGTQDILLFDSDKTIENCLKLVMPSPTMIVAAKIRDATAKGADILLTGVTMGGGPCAWAASDHLRAGFKVYATPSAARTFDDDLTMVTRMGVEVVSEDETRAMKGACEIKLRDFDYEAIGQALRAFNVKLEPELIGVAVFDHGAAPPKISDRRFRFEYLADTVNGGGGLGAFAYRRDEVPARLTRMLAVAETAPQTLGLCLMDTGPAAVLGALEDAAVRSAHPLILANIGNFHTLAFRIAESHITGIFEHHTGELTAKELEEYLRKLAQATITNEEVFENQGHGALLFDSQPWDDYLLAVTGPRRNILKGSSLRPYFAAPHGDMMMAGCFGLLRSIGLRWSESREHIERVLGPPPQAAS